MKKFIALIALFLIYTNVFAADGDLFSTGKSDEFRILDDGGISSAGTGTFTYGLQASTGYLTGGLIVTEDVNITLDAYDEEMTVTSSSGTGPMFILSNTATTLTSLGDTTLLKGMFKANGDSDGKYIQFYDNNTTDDLVFQVGSDGVITIDVSGAGSGTTISESLITANDAAFGLISTSGLTLSTSTAVNSISVGAGGHVTMLGNLILSAGTIKLPNSLYIDNSTNGSLKITDGTNTLFTVVDEGTTGSIYFGSSARKILDGTYAISVSTDLSVTGLMTASNVTSVGSLNAASINGTGTLTITGPGGADITYSCSVGSLTVTGTGIAALSLPAQSVAGADLVNDSIGDTQLAYDTGQALTTSSAVTFATVNTGQGDYELYAMNQNVRSSDAVSFAGITNTGSQYENNYLTVTDSFTVVAATTTVTYFVNGTGGILATIPDPATSAGRVFKFVNLASDAGENTFSRNINGGSFTNFDEAGDIIEILSDGADWRIVNRYEP